MAQTQPLDLKEKFILDACCGPKYMWFDKKNPNTLYIDIRREKKGYFDYRKNQEVEPDMIADFRNLPFEDKTFKLVVWDPPHLKSNKMEAGIIKTFGCLHPETWQDDLKKGFKECWRVLDDYGLLVFKFCNSQIKFKKVMELFTEKPIFGNTSSTKKGSTKWFFFMKIPEKQGENFYPTKQESLICVKRVSAETPNLLTQTSLNANI